MPDRRGSLRLNMVMNALLTLTSVIFPLITFPYISRVLLPEAVGKVYFATSLVTYFAMFAQMGVPVYGVRACARVRDDRKALSRTVQEILAMNLLLCIFVYAVYGIAIMTVPRLANEKALLAVVGISILLSAVNTDWVYQALEKYTYITVRSVIFKSIALIAMFVLIHQPEDYVIYGGISVFAISASSICNLLRLRKYINLRSAGAYRKGQHFKGSLRFFMLSVMTTIYTNLDVVMLGLMTDDASVGCYGTAVKIKIALVGIITSAGAVLLPRSSSYLENGRENEFREILQRTMNLMMLMSIPLTIYFVIFADESIMLLAGRAFRAAIPCMMVIMPTLVLIAASNLIGMQLMVPLGREKRTVEAAAIGAIVDVCINLLLIPSLGALGAAIGTLTAEIAVLAYLVYASRDINSGISSMVSWRKILAATAAAAVCSFPLKALSLGIAGDVVVTAFVFFAVYCAVILLQKEALAQEICTAFSRRIKGGSKDR